MAKALKVTRKVIQTVEVPVIALELDEDEAQILADILTRIGGRVNSRRVLADRISNALGGVGVYGGSSTDIDEYKGRAIYFLDKEES